jgi:hypothetical protein
MALTVAAAAQLSSPPAAAAALEDSRHYGAPLPSIAPGADTVDRQRGHRIHQSLNPRSSGCSRTSRSSGLSAAWSKAVATRALRWSVTGL